MRYCNKCNVIIENNLNNCPLCKQKTFKRNETPENDFPIQKIVKEDMTNRIMRILVYIFVFLSGLNIVLNLTFSFKLVWAPYSIVVLFYIYLLLLTAFKSYKNIGSIIMINVYMLSIIGFILDVLLGFSKWSINYFIPIVILSGILTLTIFLFLKPTHFLEYFIYTFIIGLFGLVLLSLLLLGFVDVILPSVTTVFVSIMVIIGTLMFGNEKAKSELVRRFHY